MTDATDISPDDSAVAAEYALGLLSPEAARAVEARLSVEPSLRADVVMWQAQFAALAEAEIDPVAPPAGLQAQIEAALFPDPVRPSLWNRIDLWRGLALAGVASTAVLAGVLFFAPAPPAQPPLVADLSAVTGEAQFVALFDPAENTLRLRRSAGDPRDGRAQEVWMIVGDAEPVSLGLFEPDGQFLARVSADLAPLLDGAILAVSDEPIGGSHTGAPTGDILAAGPVVQI